MLKFPDYKFFEHFLIENFKKKTELIRKKMKKRFIEIFDIDRKFE